MIPEKITQILQHEGVAAIATHGADGPHLVNTWNTYLTPTSGNRLLLPAGFMHKTEQNVAKNPQILLTLGSREVPGFHGPGTGYLITGTASFSTEGPDFDLMKAKFPWMRAVVAITIQNATQTL